MKRELKVFSETYQISASDKKLITPSITEQFESWRNAEKHFVISARLDTDVVDSNVLSTLVNFYSVLYIPSTEFVKYGYRTQDGKLIDPVLGEIYRQHEDVFYDDKCLVIGNSFFASRCSHPFYVGRVSDYCDGVDLNGHLFTRVFIDNALTKVPEPYKVLESVHRILEDGGELFWLESFHPDEDALWVPTMLGMGVLIERLFGKKAEVVCYGNASDRVHKLESVYGWAPKKLDAIERNSRYPLYGYLTVHKGMSHGGNLSLKTMEMCENSVADMYRVQSSLRKTSTDYLTLPAMLSGW